MLEIWTIYDSPTDLSGRFFARKWLLDQPTNQVLQGQTLEELRGKLPQGLARLAPAPQDDPCIVETWL